MAGARATTLAHADMYVNLAAHGVTDSLGLCDALLEEAGVAMTPGVDFEEVCATCHA